MKKIFIFILCMSCVFFIIAQSDTTRIELIDRRVTIDNPIGTPVFNTYESFMFRRNDTIFCLKFYPSKSQIDSVVSCGFSTRLTKKKWISISYSDKSYAIQKIKKIKSSKWFKEHNGKYFQADYQCKVVQYWSYHADGSIGKYRDFGWFFFVSETPPKKK